MYKMLIRNLQAELGTRKIYIYTCDNWNLQSELGTVGRRQIYYLLCDNWNLQAELGTRKIYIFTLWQLKSASRTGHAKNIYLLCDLKSASRARHATKIYIYFVTNYSTCMRPQAVREATACQAKTTVWQQYDNNLKYFPFIVYLQKDCQTQKQKFKKLFWFLQIWRGVRLQVSEISVEDGLPDTIFDVVINFFHLL